MAKRGITILRELLLVEIERRCTQQDCNSRNFIGLTKTEALTYSGYQCSECEQWHSDNLKQSEVPDWWDDINQEMTH